MFFCYCSSRKLQHVCDTEASEREVHDGDSEGS
jgi:hypothetical protein